MWKNNKIFVIGKSYFENSCARILYRFFFFLGGVGGFGFVFFLFCFGGFVWWGFCFVLCCLFFIKKPLCNT